MTFKELIAQFNVVARADYNKAYTEFEPKFKNLLYEYNSGPVESVNFTFSEFLTGMEKFTGSRIHNLFPEGYKFIITNQEWDYAVDIKVKDLERAANLNNTSGLNLYRQRISEIPAMAKDHPIQLAFDMLEAGDSSLYGTTFDGQNFFSETHAYGTAAGSESNIITNGAGVSAANIHADFLRGLSRLGAFAYNQGGTTTGKRRKLNTSMNNILIVAPNELHGVLFDLQNKNVLSSGETNSLQQKFQFITLPFTDATDWYMVILDDSFFRPFLYQVEKPVELDTPTPQDESYRERRIYTWGAYGRYAVAYGAWWTAVTIQNT